MLGLAYALRHAPALFAGERALRKVVVPGMDDEPHRRHGSEEAVQRRWRHGGAKSFPHRGHNGFSVLEVLDELGGGRKLFADFMRNAGFRRQPVHQDFGSRRKRAGFASELQHPRSEIRDHEPLRERLADRSSRVHGHVTVLAS